MTHWDIMLELGIKYVRRVFDQFLFQCNRRAAGIPIIGVINHANNDIQVLPTNLLVTSTLSFVRQR